MYSPSVPKRAEITLYLMKLWWIDMLVSTYLCPDWHVIGKGHDCWTAGIKAFMATYGKKAENFSCGLERCVPFPYILGNNIAAHHSVFHWYFKEFLFVLLSLLTMSRYLEDLTPIITWSQGLRPVLASLPVTNGTFFLVGSPWNWW